MAKIMVKGVSVDYYAGVDSAGVYSVVMSYYTCGYRMTSGAVMEILKRYFPISVLEDDCTYVVCEPSALIRAEWRIYVSVDHVHKEELKQFRSFRKELEKEILAH